MSKDMCLEVEGFQNLKVESLEGTCQTLEKVWKACCGDVWKSQVQMNMDEPTEGWVGMVDAGRGSQFILVSRMTLKHQLAYTTQPGLWTILDSIICTLSEELVT